MSEAEYFPIFLDVRDRRCVVLGAGPVAQEKAESLRNAGAAVTHNGRAFEPGDLAGAYLAIDASGAVDTRAAEREEADREGTLLNVVDVAPVSDWIAPAVVRRGPLQIAISTSGESPFLASALRRRIEALVGPEWEHFTRLIGRMRRRLRQRGVSPQHQQRAYRTLLRSDALSLLRDHDITAAELVAAGVSSAAERGTAGCDDNGEVVLVGAGPGDPALLTQAARDLLCEADAVFHDALVDQQALALCRGDARIVDVGKRAGGRATPQRDIAHAMIEAARSGGLVVRLKGGDPMVFGRAGEEMNALRAAGVAVRVVPGVSAAVAAPAAAEIPLTLRGVAASFAVVTAHQAEDGDTGMLERAAANTDTLVLLMPGDIERTAARLAAVVDPDRPAALIGGATTRRQQVVRGTLRTLASLAQSAGVGRPATLVVGEVVNAVIAEAADRPSVAL